MPLDLRGVCPLLQVYDMPTAIRFYRDILGFTVKATSRPSDDCDWAWLVREREIELMLNTAYDPGTRPDTPERTRLIAHGDTGLFIGCPDTDAAYAYLRGKGVNLQPPKIAHYGMKQLYFNDPDGFGICFQWPAPTPDKAERGD